MPPQLAFDPSSIQNLDGIEEVIRGQQLLANCLAHEDKHCLTVLQFSDCQGHDARRQPHHVELPQFHFLEVIAGGTCSVKFVLKFIVVEQSALGLIQVGRERMGGLDSFFRTSVQALQTRLFAVTPWATGKEHHSVDKYMVLMI